MTPEAAGRYWLAKQIVVLAVAEAKIQVWEDFGEAMENDFEILANRQMSKREETGIYPCCLQGGWRAVGLIWGYSLVLGVLQGPPESL